MGLFDVHAHLTHPKLVDDEAGILARARAAGVTTIISNGLNPVDNEAVRALAQRSTLVKPAYGLYPVDAVLNEMEAMGIDYPRDCPAFSSDDAVTWVREHASDAIAIGEIGLDGYWVPESLWELQEKIFRQLVQVALDHDKPIIIHTRKRERRAFEVLQEMGVTRANWHCFGGKVKLARRIAEYGHYLSIPANARRQQAFTRMLETLPKERVLLETDCPYLGPTRDVVNEPANVAVTHAYTAELWGVSPDGVLDQLQRNFETLFGVAP